MFLNHIINLQAKSKLSFNILSSILIIVAGFAVYINSIQGEFFWDDNFLIVDDPQIKSFSNLAKTFTQHIGAENKSIELGPNETLYFYRPVQTILFTLEYWLWKLDVRGYHLVNIFLHIAVALSLYWLTLLLFKNTRLALLTGLLFVIHPIHTEAIDCICAAANPLVSLLLILCVIFYIKQQQTPKALNFIFMILTYITALLTKENSLILPLLLLSYHYVFREKIKLKYFLSVTSLPIIYLLTRLVFLKSAVLYTSYFSAVFKRIPGIFVAITNYIKLLLFPYPLHMGHGSIIFSLTHPRAWIGIFLLSTLLFFAFLSRKRNNTLFAFSIFWFFITFLPVSNIYPLPFYMAEHYIYLPSVGFFMILAKILTHLYSKETGRRRLKYLIAALIVIYSFLTIKQNTYWKEPIAFYQRTLKYRQSPGFYNNLAFEYMKKNEYEKAIDSLTKAIEIAPERHLLYANLGSAYASIHQYEKALSALKKALEIYPDSVSAYLALGFLYSENRNYTLAIEAYKKAIELSPNHPTTCYHLANAYRMINNNEEAIRFYKKTIEIDSSLTDAYFNLGDLYLFAGNKQEAIEIYKKALKVNPNNPETHYHLSVIYYLDKQYEKAIEYCDKAKKLGIKAEEDFLNLLKPFRKQQ